CAKDMYGNYFYGGLDVW
nr:immunoglobulin heavy chain junction region [Macaca mulatta]MOX38886.1 immunoglobulin heavy chain junction region [Macaca mulatta]MOX39532.1 immunoglobulin heavy chain junction region [Macaca mulatta]MOX39691.1 immunoglobulin heavy chain junction region [Macaca mulatta]MOX40180.1 immunoglobulin heavy chain junction region [Macaca mulatta]